MLCCIRLKFKPQSRKDHDAKQQKSDIWAMHLISSNEVINAEDITGWPVGSSQALELKFFFVPSYLFV